MLLTWKKILLTENINFKDYKYYKNNRIFMNLLQWLEILQSDIYINHSEFDTLWTRYKKKLKKWQNFRNCRMNMMRKMKKKSEISKKKYSNEHNAEI